MSYYGGGGPPPPPRPNDGYDRRNHQRGGDRGFPNRRGPPRGGRGGGQHRGPPPRPRDDIVTFRSYEEEREWVEERRRKRLARGTSKFDQLPTVEQQQALQQQQGLLASASMQPAVTSQQTRHARRLYVGNLPRGVTEADVQDAFARSIETCLVTPHPAYSNDQILSVYINQERLYAFVEFKNVEITTACMDLDGLVIQGQPVKIKRPNDYNALTAPKVAHVPELDCSRLGIVASTVRNGPNKVFIGGLPYSYLEPQVMELLSAFGKLKAFHLVKNENDGTSKGYCFVEYADPAHTTMAVDGLNGMDIGGGKALTARLAGERVAGIPDPSDVTATAHQQQLPTMVNSVPPPNRTIVLGYDVEELVDAAMGMKVMPLTPTYMDPATGQPLTRVVHGGTGVTRILVLDHVVTDEDLSTDENYKGLVEEVSGECRKYGELITTIVPRDEKKRVYLQYALVEHALAAQKELQGRQFGESVVDTSFCSEEDFLKLQAAT